VFDAVEQYYQDIRLYLEVLALVAILAALAVSSLLGVIAVQMWKIASQLEQQDKRRLPTMAAPPPQPWRPTPKNPYPPLVMAGGGPLHVGAGLAAGGSAIGCIPHDGRLVTTGGEGREWWMLGL
jgi:hypothetical protein